MTPLTEIERRVINSLQGDFPLDARPFATAATPLGLDEDGLIATIDGLVRSGRVSRFGPLWNAEGLGGAVCLAAMRVPPERFEDIAAQVNAHSEIAHNYARDHELNMWFVASAADPARIDAVFRAIEEETGLPVLAMPKEREFFVGFRVEV
jgi:DNA-binding Lrp family transcriptional regulator